MVLEDNLPSQDPPPPPPTSGRPRRGGTTPPPSISIFHSSGLQVTEGVHLFAASDPAKATTDDVAGTREKMRFALHDDDEYTDEADAAP